MQSCIYLSHKIVRKIKTKVLEKGLVFSPVQRTLNEPELCKDCVDFCHRMKSKRHCLDEVSETFSEIPAFRFKSSLLLTKGKASLEIFEANQKNNFLEVILMIHPKVNYLLRKESIKESCFGSQYCRSIIG